MGTTILNQLASLITQIKSIISLLSSLHPDHRNLSMSCPVNSAHLLLDRFSVGFKEEIREVCSFAKSIPGFKCIPHRDQVVLLKAAVFEVTLVKMSVLVDGKNLMCYGSEVTDANGKLLVQNIEQLKQKINSVGLSEAETGLFCSVVIVAPDRANLSNREVLENMQASLKVILWNSLVLRHPHPQTVFCQLMNIVKELRHLSSLHSQMVFQQKSKSQTRMGLNLDSRISPGPWESGSFIKAKQEQNCDINCTEMPSPQTAKETQSYLEDRYPLLKRALEQPAGTAALNNMSKPTKHVNKPEAVDLIVRPHKKFRRGERREEMSFVSQYQRQLAKSQPLSYRSH